MNRDWTATQCSVAWLLCHHKEQDIVVIDCRFTLSAPDAGFDAYRAGHIPGAFYADLEKDLSRPPRPGDGRHPLPSEAAFAAFLERLSVTPLSRVIVYDEKGDMAPRLWWMLRLYGHRDVRVLAGGIKAWQAAGGELEAGIARAREVSGSAYVSSYQSDWMLEKKDILQRPDTPRVHHLLDARAPERYRGEMEPIDRKAGHIPGASCVPFTSLYKAPAVLRDEVELREILKPYLDGEPIGVSCGSGVTACVLAMALFEIGERPRVYVGSFSEWCADDALPIATGDH
ncbi:sulfurtransferase [Ferroacidibacillus organovorans]|uniref:Rhodanese domain-containing protein n=1 Tax=Ferroacidibacillus organovorans TaxID=1765683 RepID=A0A101XNK5_9BACL|nr:sulfurtransferase [Ferroacidibacillus organovorans]KUO94739.1 hypothetical protein ATW55_09975 [Ferroacidibacillus organovorans]